VTSNKDFVFAKKRAVVKVRAILLRAARSWFDRNDFVEVQGPILTPALGEQGNGFRVKYFDTFACLSQGLQPYSGIFIDMFGKVYSVAPAFRMEKLKTNRHLAEYWRIEGAVSTDFKSIVKVQEDLLMYVCQELSRDAPEELTLVGRHVEDMKRVSIPLPRLTYDEAIELLQKQGYKVHWGREFDWNVEKKLSLNFNMPFFVTKFPIGHERFFQKSPRGEFELTLSADLFAPEGYGEIGSSGQMINDRKTMTEKMNEMGIAQAGQQWFKKLVPHRVASYSGFALGLERIVQWICKLDRIEKAVAFPRSIDNIYP
jgi:asparaginyl-tRNA synthetase